MVSADWFLFTVLSTEHDVLCMKNKQEWQDYCHLLLWNTVREGRRLGQTLRSINVFVSEMDGDENGER